MTEATKVRQARSVGCLPLSLPRCVFRLVDKRVWDTSGSPYGVGDLQIRRSQGVVL